MTKFIDDKGDFRERSQTCTSRIAICMRVGAFVLSVGSLSACAFLFSDPPPAKKVVHFVVSPHGITARGESSIDKVMLVADIASSGRGGGRQLLFKRSAEDISAYQHTVWAEPVAVQLQEILVRRLREAELFRGVSTTQAGIVGDYQLAVQLHDFYLDQQGGKQSVVARISVELIELQGRTLVAQRGFDQSVPLAGDLTVELVVDGFSSAAERLISVDIVPWVRQQMAEKRDAGSVEGPISSDSLQ